jgi:hypothetical protein
VLDEIGPDGEVSKDTALRLFALAFGSMPGVSVPAGEVGDITSGTVAVRSLVSRWEEITDAQRAAAIRLLPELGGPDAAPSTGSSFLHLATAASPIHPASYYLEIAKSKAVLISGALPGNVRLGLDLSAAEGAVQESTSAAETLVLNAAGGRSGTASKCVIVIGRAGAKLSPDLIENFMAHEVWHCFQGQILGVDAYWTRPSWIMEGGAEWVGDTISPANQPDGWWDDYVPDPGAGLFSRTYDAIGFFAHIDDAKLDTWSRMIEMLNASGSNAAAFEAAGANSADFLDSWASGFLRQPSYGPAWDMTGPGLPDELVAIPLALAVGNSQTVKFDAAPFANSLSYLSSTADVLEFAVTGHVRLADPPTNQEYILGATSMFCTKSDGCECPPGTEFAGAPPSPLSPESVLAASSNADATTGTITGVSLDEFCKGQGATWHFDSPARYSGGPSHVVVDAYTCTTLQGPWTAVMHATHTPATSPDPPLDVLVKFTWTFDQAGRATPVIGPYNDTVYGTTHSIVYYPVLKLDKAAATITVVSLMGSEDGSPRIDVDDEVGRLGEAVPLKAEQSPQC